MKALMTSLLMVTFLYTPTSWGLTEKVLEIAPDQKVFYRYKKARRGQPTVVLLNGLIYAISHWDNYVDELTKKGIGVVQVAYSTQPESLVHLDDDVSPFYSETQWFFGGLKQKGIETQTQVDEVMAVLDELKIEKFNIISLSYGSIVASQLAVQQKDNVQNLILIAPAVKTTGRYNAWGKGRHAYYSFLVAAGNPLADYSYDQEIKGTLSMLITPTQYQFSGVEFDDFFNGVYQMARSSKWFDLHDYSTMELPNTYLFLATLEDAPLYADQLEFWSLMENNSAKKSVVTFEGSYHAIPGVAPKKAAAQTIKILRGKMKKAEVTVKVSNQKGISSDKQSSFFSSDSFSSGSK